MTVPPTLCENYLIRATVHSINRPHCRLTYISHQGYTQTHFTIHGLQQNNKHYLQLIILRIGTMQYPRPTIAAAPITFDRDCVSSLQLLPFVKDTLKHSK